MIHLVYSVQTMRLSDYFNDRETSEKSFREDIIFMMNSYTCPKEIACKVKAVYTLKNKEELQKALYKNLTADNVKLRSWY